MSDTNPSQNSVQSNDEALEAWTKPEIISFEPVAGAQSFTGVGSVDAFNNAS